jgi:hypothetical protein
MILTPLQKATKHACCYSLDMHLWLLLVMGAGVALRQVKQPC